VAVSDGISQSTSRQAEWEQFLEMVGNVNGMRSVAASIDGNLAMLSLSKGGISLAEGTEALRTVLDQMQRGVKIRNPWGYALQVATAKQDEQYATKGAEYVIDEEMPF
jgi:hypothetical protein